MFSPIRTINARSIDLAKTAHGRRHGEPGELTTADLVVLSLLEERAMHGYDLLAEYQRQEVVDWASVSKAQIYYALNKLAERGLIDSVVGLSSARERTIYAPTESGRNALRNALADENWASRRIAQPFATWLGLSIHAEADAYRTLLVARRAFLIAEIEKEKASLSFIAELASARAKRGSDIVTLIIRQLEVELEWVDQIIDRN
jgi:DNA-binding PadR family transcriptional regulator